MNIDFDPAKDDANTEKHGVSLAFGREVLRDANRLDVLDVRVAHIETRYVTYGMVDGRVWVCVFAPRTDAHRIISVRKANARETRRYHDTPR